LSLKTGKTT